MSVAVAPATGEQLPVLRAGELAVEQPEERWLIRSLWAREAVGIIGGPPKSCKSFLGLDMATSVASNTPCLGRFPVDGAGPALVYLAEDALPMVRVRIEALCQHRGLDIAKLDLHVIATPALRLDLERDQARLAATLDSVRPQLLLLDPLVRLHRLDENSALEISGLLGYLRELQRAYGTAIALVHYASKKHRAQPGQALRGSGDLHAFGDSNAYLARHKQHLTLTLEHRAARPPEPMALELVSAADGTRTHLCVVGASPSEPDATPLPRRVLDQLAVGAQPRSRAALRAELRVNNNRLGDALVELERRGRVVRTPAGWTLAPASGAEQTSLFS